MNVKHRHSLELLLLAPLRFGDMPVIQMTFGNWGMAWLSTESSVPLRRARKCVHAFYALEPNVGVAHKVGYDEDKPDGTGCAGNDPGVIPQESWRHPIGAASNAVPLLVNCRHNKR